MSVQAIAWVLEHSQTKGTARCVMISIANHLDPYGEGWAYVKTVLDEARCSRDSYHRACAEAEKLGELIRLLNDGGTHKTHGDKRPNQFQFPAMRVPQVAHPATEPVPQVAGGPVPQVAGAAGAATCPPIAVPLLAVNEAIPHLWDDVVVFEAFWMVYPAGRRVDKKRARAAWAKAVRDAADPEFTAKAIQDSAEAWARFWSVERTEAKFIPHPTTWLNGERWTVPVPVPAKKGNVRKVAPRDAWDDEVAF